MLINFVRVNNTVMECDSKKILCKLSLTMNSRTIHARSFELVMNEWIVFFSSNVSYSFQVEKNKVIKITIFLWWQNANQDVWEAPLKKGVRKKKLRLKPNSSTEHISVLTSAQFFLHNSEDILILPVMPKSERKYDINFPIPQVYSTTCVCFGFVALRLIVQIFCVFIKCEKSF